MKPLRVGELSAITGVSVRALHYYEELGLLMPERTETGHRRYGESALVSLQQIRSMRQLGFSLGEIGRLLRQPDPNPEQIVRWQAAIDALRANMEAGVDAKEPDVRLIADQIHQEAAAFIPDGDASVHDAVMQLLHDEPQARRDHGLDDALFSYFGRALAPDDHK